MEIDNPGPSSGSRKRTVDADNTETEVADPKRPRINFDSDLKKRVLNYIVDTGFKLYDLFKINELLYNITVSHQVMSIMQGAHNIIRKMANARSSTHPNLDLSATVISMGNNSKSYREITTVMKEVAKTHNLKYTASNCTDNTHWYGVANPLFNIIAAYKLSYDEIRLGVSKIPIAKRGTTTDYIDISQYGLTPAHHILLEGSTYKPERRSAMAKTLGPLTAVLAAYKSKNPYRAKWIEAVKRNLTHIPNSHKVRL